ncbi:MAG TPA: right-handed parallel beta-helix repeat-containing protein, partial [Solirubrobacterales bacterium]|nr:right-handed parallel beta-helix repeat-containing protein [Solirubrobacterales bacterium]
MRYGITTALLALAALLSSAAPASATPLPATVSENMTLTTLGSPYTGSSTVEPGVTLTVEPGVRLNLGELVVKGTLRAEGTAEAPIVFSGPFEKVLGEWERVKFEPGSGASVLDHVEVKFGSWSPTKGMIEVVGSSPAIRNSTVSKSGGYGIRVVKGGSPEIAGDRFVENSQYAVSYEAEAGNSGEVDIHGNTVEKGGGGILVSVNAAAGVYGKALSGNTVTETTGYPVFYNGPDIPGDVTQNAVAGNPTDCILAEGTVAHTSTWLNANTEVCLELGVTVASGVTLTIAPGLVFLPNHNFTVKGTLKAEGTVAEPIVFTSSTETSPGAWEQIKFEPGSGASVLDHVEAKYGGWSAAKGMIEVVGSSPTIRNSTIAKSGGYGVKVLQGGSPEIAGNRFVEDSQYAVSYNAEAGNSGEIDIHGNTVEKGGGGILASINAAAGVYGKTLSSNTIVGTSGYGVFYNGPDIPGDVTQNNLSANPNNVILAEGTVAHSSTWTNGGAKLALELGVTVAAGATLTMEPGLVVMPGHSITVKGTLKAEGTAEAPILFTGPSESTTGEWEQIRFEGGSGASVLDHVEAKFGSWSGTQGMIEVLGSSPTIRNSTIQRSGGYGIKVVESGSPKIEWDRFRANAVGGLSYGGTGTLAAPHNDWNCASGPKPAGCGEAVSGNVNWNPAVQLPEPGGHCRGKESD